MQWYDSSYITSVQFPPHRAKQWWSETREFVKFLHLQYKLDLVKRSVEIFDDIKNRKIDPLRLTRSISIDAKYINKSFSKFSLKSNRLLYPLAKNDIEFEEVIYSHAKSNMRRIYRFEGISSEN